MSSCYELSRRDRTEELGYVMRNFCKVVCYPCLHLERFQTPLELIDRKTKSVKTPLQHLPFSRKSKLGEFYRFLEAQLENWGYKSA